MSSDLPHDPISANVPQDWGRLISMWVKDLQSARRAEAIQGLSGFVRNRLAALAEYIDFSAADGQPQVAKPGVGAANGLEQGLFGDESEIANEMEFYQRSAAVIRDVLLDRLENVFVTGEAQAARSYARARRAAGGQQVKSRLDWWCEFHREAGRLPPTLLAIHDLMYYARLPLAEASAVLGKPVEVVATEKAEVVRRLRPLFNQARGKA